MLATEVFLLPRNSTGKMLNLSGQVTNYRESLDRTAQRRDGSFVIIQVCMQDTETTLVGSYVFATIISGGGTTRREHWLTKEKRTLSG
jgi:hypothetical protein